MEELKETAPRHRPQAPSRPRRKGGKPKKKDYPNLPMAIAIGLLGVGLLCASVVGLQILNKMGERSVTTRQARMEGNSASVPEAETAQAGPAIPSAWRNMHRAIGVSATSGPLSFTVADVLVGDKANSTWRNNAISNGNDVIGFSINVENQSTDSLVVEVDSIKLIDSNGNNYNVASTWADGKRQHQFRLDGGRRKSILIGFTLPPSAQLNTLKCQDVYFIGSSSGYDYLAELDMPDSWL